MTVERNFVVRNLGVSHHAQEARKIRPGAWSVNQETFSGSKPGIACSPSGLAHPVRRSGNPCI